MKKKYTIKELRIKQRMTREEFAELMDVSVWSVQKYELGLRKPSLKSIKMLEDHFNVEVI